MNTKIEQKKESNLIYGYRCPACTEVALKSSNKMMGIDTTCQKCGKTIKLDNEQNYFTL